MLRSLVVVMAMFLNSVQFNAVVNGRKTNMQTRYGDLAIKIKDGKAVIDREPKLIIPQSDKPKYKSKWEESYSVKLELEKHAGIIKAWWYEPFSLWLPGKVRYKPDFLIQYPAGLERSLEIIEVKGWSKNRRDGMTRLKIAAALFPCFVWRMVYRTKGGGWDGEYLSC